MQPSPPASDQKAHFYTLCSATSRTEDRALLTSTIHCIPRQDLGHGCELGGVKALELKLISLFYLYFLEQVQGSVWEDEGQVHPSSRHTGPHQSQEGLLECQWCMHPFHLSSLVTGTTEVELPKKQKILQSYPSFQVLAHNTDQEKNQKCSPTKRHKQYQLSKVAMNNTQMLKVLTALLGKVWPFLLIVW